MPNCDNPANRLVAMMLLEYPTRVVIKLPLSFSGVIANRLSMS